MGCGVSKDGSPMAREYTFSPRACLLWARLNISNAGESGTLSRNIVVPTRVTSAFKRVNGSPRARGRTEEGELHAFARLLASALHVQTSLPCLSSLVWPAGSPQPRNL